MKTTRVKIADLIVLGPPSQVIPIPSSYAPRNKPELGTRRWMRACNLGRNAAIPSGINTIENFKN